MQPLGQQGCAHCVPFGTSSASTTAARCLACVQGVTMHVPAGTSCAIVGTSGSGKSTILRLLYRSYDLESGVLGCVGASTLKSGSQVTSQATSPWIQLLVP